MSFFDELSAIFARGEFSQSGDSPWKVGQNEHVIGECSLQMKVILTHIQKLRDQAGDYESCLLVTDERKEPDTFKKYWGECQLLYLKINFLRKALTLIIYDQYEELLMKKGVGFRTGWQIVYTERIPDAKDRTIAFVVAGTGACHGQNVEDN